VTTLAIIILLVASVAAAVDWWAVARGDGRLERMAKPAAMAMLIALAMTAGDASGDVRFWLVFGATFGLVGDIALLGKGERSFIVGLGSFAVGHLGYVVAAIAFGVESWLWVVGVAYMTALLAFRFISHIVPGAYRHGGQVLGGAVVFYAMVISAMVISTAATGVLVAAGGAMLFAASDWIIGYDRFVQPVANRGLIVMVPYHLGQTLLILGLLLGLA
jgi:uncharacterized membrane protein YhhN